MAGDEDRGDSAGDHSAATDATLAATAAIGVGDHLGRYRLLSVLGKGGFGEVFRASHEGPHGFRKQVALKRIHPNLLDEDARFLGSLINEARLGGLLRHRNIVETYEFAEDGDEWFIAMEYVRGVSFDRLIERCRSTEAELPIGLVLAIGEQICSGLHYAHNLTDDGEPLAIIHRDLKPANLMLTAEGVVKIMDFGIARAASNLYKTTSAGQSKGTPAYMSPEQVNGKPDICARSDLFSLGAILYELATATTLFAAESPVAAMFRVVEDDCSDDVARLDERLPGLAAVVGRCLAKEADERWPRARELGLALRQLKSETSGSETVEELAGAILRDDESVGLGRTQSFVPGMSPEFMQFTSRFLSTAAEPWRPFSEKPLASATPVRSAAVKEAESAASRPRPAAAGDDAATRLERPTGTQVGAPPQGAATQWRAIVIAVLVLGVVTIGWLWSRQAERRSTATPSASPPAPTPPRPPGPFVLLGKSSVPTDLTAIVTRTRDSLVLAGQDSFYLIPTGTGQPSRLPAAGIGVIGAAGAGAVWTDDGSGIARRDFASGKSQPWLAALPTLSPMPARDRASRLFMAPGGRHLAVVQARHTELYRIDGGSAKLVTKLPQPAAERVSINLSDHYLVRVIPGLSVVTNSTSDGAELSSQPFAELNLRSVAINDAGARIAVGGWFDSVMIYAIDGADPIAITRHGATNALAWLGEGPTLVIAGNSGVSLWSQARGQFAKVTDTAVEMGSLHVSARGIHALAPQRHELWSFAYRGLPEPARVSLSQRELWAVAPAPDGSMIYAGGKDGVLHTYDPADAAINHYNVHSDGITALTVAADHIASASDDKTIAVWDRARMQVTWRSRAHGFLVNQLALRGNPPALWSSSSDGTVKRWSWPSLELAASLATAELLGDSHSLQALWVGDDGERVVAGSWRSKLVVFARKNRKWHAHTHAVASRGLYRVAELGDGELLAFAGVEPAGLYLYSPARDRLATLLLPDGADTFWVMTHPRGDTIDVLGAGIIIRYTIARSGDKVSFSGRALVDTELGIIFCAAYIDDGRRIVAGNGSGELLIVDADSLDQAPVVVSGERPL